MKRILMKNKGASMLLAISIFLILAVIGFNVLAAAYSNVNGMGKRFENEQAMLYVTSIYETVDRKMQAGEFKIEDCFDPSIKPDSANQSEMQKCYIKTDPATLNDKQMVESGEGEILFVQVWFYRFKDKSDDTVYVRDQVKMMVDVKYAERTYTITSVYKKLETSGNITYDFLRCEGVVSK